MKIGGEMHYLWRAVDHKGEVLESYATKTIDKAAALRFMKKTLKRTRCWPGAIIMDGVRSYEAAMSKSLVTPRSRRSGAGRITGSRTRTDPSDDESERCSGSGK